MSIAAGITATRAALEVAKITMDKLNTGNIDVAAVRTNVHELLIHVLNAQVALGEAQVENSELRHQPDDRDALKVLAADVEHVEDGGFLVLKSEREQEKLVPYCPVCWGAERKIVALQPMANGFYTCALHKSSYQTQAYREEKRRAYQRANEGPRPSIDPNSWMARLGVCSSR